jgi:hypothetical protein
MYIFTIVKFIHTLKTRMPYLAQYITNTIPQFIPYEPYVVASLGLLVIALNIPKVTLIGPLEFLAGAYMADFITGLVHLLGDRNDLAQEHHMYPHLIVRLSVLARSFDYMVAGLILTWINTYIQWNWIHYTVIIGSFTNEYHCWQHQWDKSPNVAKLLWELGLLADPYYHHRHHTNTKGTYSIVNGWSNPVLELLDALLDYIN